MWNERKRASVCLLKGIVHLKIIIYSPSCHSKAVLLSSFLNYKQHCMDKKNSNIFFLFHRRITGWILIIHLVYDYPQMWDKSGKYLLCGYLAGSLNDSWSKLIFYYVFFFRARIRFWSSVIAIKSFICKQFKSVVCFHLGRCVCVCVLNTFSVVFWPCITAVCVCVCVCVCVWTLSSVVFWPCITAVCVCVFE